MLLFAHRWRNEFKNLVSWTIIIGVMAFAALYLAMIFANLEETSRLIGEWLSKAPPAIRALVGAGMSALLDPTRFVTGMAFNTILPGIVLVFVCLSVVGIYTREAGRGNLEFLLALPIKRIQVGTGRVLVFLLNLLVVHVAIYMGAAMGLAATDAGVDVGRTALVLINQYLLFSTIGGAVFLFSLTSKDFNKVLLVTLALFFGLFSLNVFMETKQQFPELMRSVGRFILGQETFSTDFISIFNPFYYYDPSRVLVEGEISWWNYLVLWISSLLLWFLGLRTYVRKQI